MLIYVVDKYGHPLMPTRRAGKVRRLLKSRRAVIIRRCPFTIMLLYDCTTYTQDISLGIDAGSKHVGASATTTELELYASDTELRNDIVKLLAARAEARRTRRNRLRYREARFNNRKKDDGWLAPSIVNKIETHLSIVKFICSILPIKHIIVETAAFDMQKLKADMEGLKRPSGVEYQQGEQMGFWNVREYVLHRDGHKCQCCKGKSGDSVLNVHHIESRQTGGNAPNNLIALCETCHKGYHAGTVKLPARIKRGAKFNDAVFMGIMRWAFFNKLKEIYEPSGIDVKMTFGYITKNTRIQAGLEKDHYIDARCISGNPNAKPLGYVYYQKKVRCHNRKLHKSNILKGGKLKANQAPRLVFGFGLYDKVLYNGQECFIYGRRSTGYFDLRLLDGTHVNDSVSYKKLKLVERAKHTLTQRIVALPTTKVTGLRCK